jgi:hypothetical protein
MALPWYKMVLIALFVAFLHLAGHFRYLTDPVNRYKMLWDRQQAAGLLLSLGVLAVAALTGAWAAQKLGHRSPRVRRGFRHVFLLVLLSGIIAALPFPQDALGVLLARLGVLAGVAILGWSLARPNSSLFRYGVRLCLIFSPAPLILIVQMLLWPSWRDPAASVVAAPEDQEAGSPVVLIIFDAWSGQRVMANGHVRPCFRNLSALSRQATLFNAARSPWDWTAISVPRILYQQDLRLIHRHGRVFCQIGETVTPSVQVPSLHHRAKWHGYATLAVGTFLPQSRILGDAVDETHDYSYYPRGDGVVEEMGIALLRAMRFWRDPVSRRVADPLNWEVFNNHHRRVHKRALHVMERTLVSGPRRLFAAFHLMVPHHPYIWDADGTYRGPQSEPMNSPAGYVRSLRYVDTLVGRIVEFLKRGRRFDDALLILTADHSWRATPDRRFEQGADWVRNVPLIIKLPGQQEGRKVHGRIVTNRLAPLFEAVFAGERDPRRLADIARRLAGEDPE